MKKEGKPLDKSSIATMKKVANKCIDCPIFLERENYRERKGNII